MVFCCVSNLSKIQVKLLNGSLTQAIQRRLQEIPPIKESLSFSLNNFLQSKHEKWLYFYDF